MPWNALIPKEQIGVKEGSKGYDVIMSMFVEPHGTDLKKENITNDLNKCVMTKKELKKYKF